MSIGRRTSSDSRRRRVLVYQSSRDNENGTSPDRRLVEKLRQARRPASIYGASVNRRLRGRWFSLVPVRRRAMAGASLAILGTATLLCLAHWLAITWQPLAYREALARPLRLDRADSFGTWARAVFLGVAAGTSLLVYQLRRYRNDDYRGSYRIWPPVIILIALTSLDCVCGLVPWCGELIDLLLGKRIAMAGSDWIRIGMTVGGAALALRLIAEVRHSKLAIVMMMLSILCFATPLAGRWGILLSDTPLKWWLITSAPLMAAATLCVSCGAYLRKLFREVRRLDEDDQLSLRLRQWKARVFPGKAKEIRDVSELRIVKPAAETAKSSTTLAAPIQKVGSPPAVKASSPGKPAAEEPKPRKRRFGWLFGRGKRPAVELDRFSKAVANDTPEPAVKIPSVVAGATTSIPKPVIKQAPEPVETGKDLVKVPKQRRGLSGMLGGWLRRSKPTAAANPTGKTQTASAASSDSRPALSQSGDDEDNDVEDDSSIDWASMSKAERRRLRRELKRSGDAA